MTSAERDALNALLDWLSITELAGSGYPVAARLRELEEMKIEAAQRVRSERMAE